MALYHSDPSFSPKFLAERSIFKRCIECETAAPECPACKPGSTCTMISRSCDQCATTKCIQTSTSSNSGSQDNSSDGGGSNAGAIAGGVIGGLAFIGIVTFLVWWFFIRKKRKEYDQQRGDGSEKSSSFNDARQARKSTQSIASTVLTRASNVIQIAYIPGVTNRSPPETPLVPPVPPLPGAAPDQHFFMPGDLRDSSWSDMTGDHRSVAPSLRSSVATTIYRNNAIVSPMPAQQVMRTRAAVVSIHNGGGPESESLAPPDAPAVPAITPAQLAKAGVAESNSNSSIVARTVTAKPVMVKGPAKRNPNNSSPAVQTIEEQPESSASSSTSPNTKQLETPTSGFDASSSDEEDEAQSATNARRTAVDSQSRASTQSPFRDHLETNPRASSILELKEGTRSNRSSRVPPPRVESPFSDANEVK
ncbi:hypothetical protein FE257_002880 [Aspergillus nanangensis]|uniref:Membrane anchor Opy2 N-terminal domain-containing protein n=1 Tax=Aspergillus nanangensis TaxID=2582783 RepID=A0AAD4CUF5_ASPNN|nr:hypothetical protein FE257_002880 [Aspergillus nanangensis]